MRQGTVHVGVEERETRRDPGSWEVLLASLLDLREKQVVGILLIKRLIFLFQTPATTPSV
jgi:hypothetical protein